MRVAFSQCRTDLRATVFIAEPAASVEVSFTRDESASVTFLLAPDEWRRTGEWTGDLAPRCLSSRCLTHGDLSPRMGCWCRQVNSTPLIAVNPLNGVARFLLFNRTLSATENAGASDALTFEARSVIYSSNR
jgi:hypothetical protein